MLYNLKLARSYPLGSYHLVSELLVLIFRFLSFIFVLLLVFLLYFWYIKKTKKKYHSAVFLLKFILHTLKILLFFVSTFFLHFPFKFYCVQSFSVVTLQILLFLKVFWIFLSYSAVSLQIQLFLNLFCIFPC